MRRKVISLLHIERGQDASLHVPLSAERFSNGAHEIGPPNTPQAGYYQVMVSRASKPQRLDAMLSRYGYCSRSEARVWLKGGRVLVCREPARSPAQKAMPEEVTVDGNLIECPEGLLAVLFKPANYVCTHSTREGPTIHELLPPRWQRRHPPVTSVGRLDRDATGLLLITDRGDLVHRWTSPRHKVPKLYEVSVDGPLSSEIASRFASGELQLDGERQPCLPARLEVLSEREARLELVEGRFHQVKRMFASQGLTVTRLHRTRFGEYGLGSLKPGEWRLLPVPARISS